MVPRAEAFSGIMAGQSPSFSLYHVIVYLSLFPTVSKYGSRGTNSSIIAPQIVANRLASFAIASRKGKIYQCAPVTESFEGPNSPCPYS
jgi:hypothetical protein